MHHTTDPTPDITRLQVRETDIIDVCAICGDWVIDRHGQPPAHAIPTDHQAVRSDTVAITGAVVAVRRLASQLAAAASRLNADQAARPDVAAALRLAHEATGTALASPDEVTA